ncbi:MULTISPECIES: rhamnogalacturonan acetylesterase [Prevotellaceae]|uniref:Rhamnogalacturonan acetylesterase n=1 Tax=Xylanibacter rodentium TaxID=2736289 RepID=A0ABX2ATJ6_9BACT|nr:rhamnogalacturonan acetylesterase [Prevotella sp. PJ1A]NPE13710.1 rhamnogalacturonan acetylesterase [Xylanibacter rodentium]NPE38930.1 rhamnogalacturonan acetylesterase [Prevotella sp. PCJ2]
MKRLLSTIAIFGASVTMTFGQVPDVMEDVNKVVDNTPDSIAKALMARPKPGTTRRGQQPVLFLIGNSTMRNGTLGNGNNGQWGWGYFEHEYFDLNKISVENQALGGMSTRTYYNQLWPAVREALKPGDWVIISIGHNDGGPIDSGRARSVLKGTGHDSVEVTIKETGVKETVYTYGGYMRKYIADCRAKGANPILMSLTPRNAYDEQGKIVRKPQGQWLEEISREQGVPYVDLNEISGAKLDMYGKWKESYHFYKDNIHTSRFGAVLNARSAAEGLAANTDPQLAPLQAMMKPLTLPAVAVKRETGKPVVFFTGDSTVKNEDKDDDGMWGWASQAYTVFNPKKITCMNSARAGRSTRTFLNEGLWDRVYNSLQPGDFVLIQFGHNDIGPIDDKKMRGVIPGTSDSTKVFRMKDSGKYELVYTFGWYLKKFIQDVREKGATPILVTITPRNEWKDGKIERRNDTYGKWYREVAEQTGTELVDLHNITADYLDKKCGSKDKAMKYYKRDHTHTSLLGAKTNAKSVAKGLKANRSPLAEYLR